MKCHYEELGVARDASDAEIKTAYRKLALRWHPDKNPDCTEAAKERFQLIQQAYDVLSDSQERAWYDNHREQILRGKNSEYEDNCLDLFQYFTVSCFKGYGDDERGFYRVYSHVFEKIAEEDAEFIEDEEAVASIPKFGDSNSSYEEVVGPFYAYWQSYCTKRTYSWLCPYDVQEIKDRRILREIEKDMKKIVQKAKKERNEEVRNLVSFIRKRDKRVQQYKQLLEERAALNRLKQEQNRLEQIRRRNRELEEMRRNYSHTFNDGYEEQLKQLEQQYGSESSCEEEDESEDELDEAINVLSMVEEEEYVDDLYCVACNKAFKNENAFANHETSKKHRDNLERLKKEMLEEEELYGEEHEDGSSQEESYKDGESQAEGTDGDDGALGEAKALAEDDKKASKKEKKDKKSKKGKKMCTQQKIEPPFSEDEELSARPLESRSAEEREEIDWSSSSKRGAGKKAKTKQSKSKSAESKAKTKSPHETPPQNTLPVEVPAPRAASPSETAAHTCVTCKAGFESKNKLFAHLKKLNHGVYIPKPKAEPLDTSKKSKSKRK